MNHDTEVSKTIGQKVRYYRRLKSLSQEDLSIRLEKDYDISLTRTSITHYESGRNQIPLSLIPKIAQILGVEPQKLTGESELPDENKLQSELFLALRQVSELTRKNSELEKEVERLNTEIQSLKSD